MDGRNTDDKMSKMLYIYRKIPVIFLSFWGHIHVGILCRMPFKSILFRCVYPTPFLQSHVIPFFVRSIATPLTTIFLQNGTQCCFGVVSQRFESANQPTCTPLPSCIPSTLVAPSHARFYFLNSLSFFSKYRHIHILSQDSYLPSFMEWFT